MLRIELSTDPLQRDLDRLGELSRKAISRSLNRTVRSARVHASRIVRRELNMKAGDVRKDLSVSPARRSLTQAELVIGARAVPLIRYGARQTRRGVTVKVKKQGARKLLPHAFIARMKSGHVGVFSRRKGIGRLPIQERQSTALVQFINDPKVIQEIGEHGREVFVKELAHNVAFLSTQG